MAQGKNQAKEALDWIMVTDDTQPNGVRLIGDRAMAGVVLLKSGLKTNYLRLFDAESIYNETPDDLRHIEVKLMDQLVSSLEWRTVLTSRTAEDVTVIFASRWSPCINCCQYRIPQFLNNVSRRLPDIRVKFLFEQYWSRINVQDRDHLFASNQLAQQKYDELSIRYGTVRRQDSLKSRLGFRKLSADALANVEWAAG